MQGIVVGAGEIKKRLRYDLGSQISHNSPGRTDTYMTTYIEHTEPDI